jgi:hypothetical protein
MIPTTTKEDNMFRIDVWVPRYGCFYPGINLYATEAEAKERAKALRRAGHKVKIVPKDAPTYTEV